MPSIRLRQIALSARDLEFTAELLGFVFDRPVAHRDPGVGIFGLENVLFRLGDSFLEVVSPVQSGTTVGRLLDRQKGTCGYMVIFQVEELEGVRRRVEAEGVRVVWEVAFDEAATIHLHPKDIGGGVVSFDRMASWDAWAWAGEEGSVPQPGDPLTLRGVEIAAADPDARAVQWGRILEVPTGNAAVQLGERTIRFHAGADAVTAVELGAADPEAILSRARDRGLPVEGESFQLGNVTFRLVPGGE